MDVCAELSAGKGQIVAVHVKDAIRSEVRGIALGRGIVDFPAAFSQLAANHYSGPFLLEMWDQPGQDALANSRDALQFTRKMLKASAYFH